MKNKWFVFGTIGFAIAIYFVAVFNQKETSQQPTEHIAQSSEVANKTTLSLSTAFIRPHSPRIGNNMARVTVVEWLDPECESCRAMHPAVKRIIADYKDKVLFVVRYMPYHSGSMFAASALEEAHELGKFEEALSLLFEKQPEWGNHREPRPDLIPSYLVTLGIPLENLDREKLIEKHGDKVLQDQEDGTTVGVEGTPSFFVNEIPLQHLGEDQLRASIDEQLALTNN